MHDMMSSMPMMSRMNGMMSSMNEDPIEVIGNVHRHGYVIGMMMLSFSFA
jgi:hypothetical protein